MDVQRANTMVLLEYYAGVATDLPIVSPHARKLASLHPSIAISEPAVVNACVTDPFLCAKICGVANSVFYNHEHHAVFSLEDSIRRVGLHFAKSLLLEAPRLPTEVDETQIGMFWAHCMSVAHAASSIASEIDAPPFDKDVAYFIGIVHDIGYLLQLEFDSRLTLEAHQVQLAETAEDDGHVAHGEALARHWSLPIAAVRTIRHHHEPALCNDSDARWLSQVISVSEWLAGRDTIHTAGVPCRRFTATAPIHCHIDALELSDDSLERIAQECVQIYEKSLTESARIAATFKDRHPCLKIINK